MHKYVFRPSIILSLNTNFLSILLAYIFVMFSSMMHIYRIQKKIIWVNIETTYYL